MNTFNDIEEQILFITNQFPGRIGVDIETNSGLSIEINAKKNMRSASLIKLPIAAYIDSVISENSALLDEEIFISNDNMVGGAGVIRFLSPKYWKISDLLFLMIEQSDNTATNCLLDYFGLSNIQKWISDNYSGISLNRKMMQYNGVKDNFTNVADILGILKQFKSRSTPVNSIVMRAMRHQVNRSKLVAVIQPRIETYNKSGENEGVENDAAIFIQKDKWVIVVVQTEYYEQSESIKLIRTIGSEVGKYFL